MSRTVLQARELTKHYGELTAVRDLSLEVYEGEVFGLLGPNGAGKTTSINMLCGLLKPDAGQVLIHGKPITTKAPADAAKSCSRNSIFQKKKTNWRARFQGGCNAA